MPLDGGGAARRGRPSAAAWAAIEPGDFVDYAVFCEAPRLITGALDGPSPHTATRATVRLQAVACDGGSVRVRMGAIDAGASPEDSGEEPWFLARPWYVDVPVRPLSGAAPAFPPDGVDGGWSTRTLSSGVVDVYCDATTWTGSNHFIGGGCLSEHPSFALGSGIQEVWGRGLPSTPLRRAIAVGAGRAAPPDDAAIEALRDGAGWRWLELSQGPPKSSELSTTWVELGAGQVREWHKQAWLPRMERRPSAFPDDAGAHQTSSSTASLLEWWTRQFCEAGHNAHEVPPRSPQAAPLRIAEQNVPVRKDRVTGALFAADPWSLDGLPPDLRHGALVWGLSAKETGRGATEWRLLGPLPAAAPAGPR